MNMTRIILTTVLLALSLSASAETYQVAPHGTSTTRSTWPYGNIPVGSECDPAVIGQNSTGTVKYHWLKGQLPPNGIAAPCVAVASSPSSPIDTTAPTVPTGLSATTVSSSQINLSWSASTDNIGVTGYDIYRGGTLITTVTGTPFSNTGLTSNTAYTYTVRAKDAAGNTSAQSTSVSAKTQVGVSLQGYSTNFDLTENPISEGGAWSHVGLDWTTVQTSGGIAYGTQTGSGGYDDSYATLSGFPSDQSASAVIHLINNIDTSCSHEVELHLRWNDTAHSAQGYEVNMSFDGGAQIVRWNGAIGSYTVLGGGSFRGLKDGDVFKASMIGNVITAYVNDIQVAQVTDAAYSTGNPGIGFFRRNCGTNADFGFTSFTATSF